VNPVRPKLRLDLLLALALVVVAVLVSNATRVRVHEAQLGSDEPEWIAASILHWQQFVHGAPAAGAELDPPEERSDNTWKRGFQRTTFGYMNPCLPKLVWGAVLAARGYDEASPLAFQIFGRSDAPASKAAHEALLPALATARNVVVALSALTAVLLFFVARELGGGVSGWVGAALAFGLWFASPLVRNTSSYVRTDYFMLPLCLAGALVALRNPRVTWRTGLALGVLCGLATASKLNGGLLCIATALWFGAAALRERSARPLAALALAGLLTVVIFWALNPRLWSEPVAGVGDMLARWDKLMAYFQDELAPRTHVEVARTQGERLSLFVRKTLTRDDPLRPVGAALMLAGIVLLALRMRRPQTRDGALIALAFVAVFVVGTIAWLPLDWERFYLTALPWLVLLEVVPVIVLVERLAQRRASAHA
jgi:hypothetical protein